MAKLKRWTSSNGKVEFQLHENDVRAIAQIGSNDAAVERVVEQTYLQTQPSEFSPEDIREELSEFGAWDEAELADHNQNLRRLVWLAAWDIYEEQNE